MSRAHSASHPPASETVLRLDGLFASMTVSAPPPAGAGRSLARLAQLPGPGTHAQPGNGRADPD